MKNKGNLNESSIIVHSLITDMAFRIDAHQQKVFVWVPLNQNPYSIEWISSRYHLTFELILNIFKNIYEYIFSDVLFVEMRFIAS